MTRLTKDLRGQLANAVVKQHFEEELQVIYDQYEQLASDVFDACFTKKEHDLMASLPKGWLNDDTDIKVEFGGEVASLNFNGDCWAWRMDTRGRFHRRDSESRKMPPYAIGSVVKQFPTDHKLSKRYTDLKRGFDDYRDRVSRTRRETMSVLESVTTFAKLIEVWPEMKPFTDALNIATPLKNVPAKKISELSDALGLAA